MQCWKQQTTDSGENMLTGKCVVVGVCGGIAAYKVVEVVSRLKKLGAEVHVIMTESAQQFVGELTFRTMSQNPVAADMFGTPARWEVEHVSLAQKADLFLVAPATANTIAKMAYGIADNMLLTTYLATRAPVMIAPAMNKNMYTHPVTVENMKKLSDGGCSFVRAGEGFLACGDTGVGRMAEPAEIVSAVVDAIARTKDLAGKRVLVTAGATQEPLDPVRFITNHSSGKMGVSIAHAAKLRGAEVVLVHGKTCAPAPYGVESVCVGSAQEMYAAVLERAKDCDIIVKAAAVADYAPADVSTHKMKKSDADLTLPLQRNPDILKALGENKHDGQILVGFCMETQDLLVNAQTKLEKKNCDLMVANSLTEPGAGFGCDTNTVTILKKNGEKLSPENMSKAALAHIILDEALKV